MSTFSLYLRAPPHDPIVIQRSLRLPPPRTQTGEEPILSLNFIQY